MIWASVTHNNASVDPTAHKGRYRGESEGHSSTNLQKLSEWEADGRWKGRECFGQGFGFGSA